MTRDEHHRQVLDLAFEALAPTLSLTVTAKPMTPEEQRAHESIRRNFARQAEQRRQFDADIAHIYALARTRP